MGAIPWTMNFCHVQNGVVNDYVKFDHLLFLPVELTWKQRTKHFMKSFTCTNTETFHWHYGGDKKSISCWTSFTIISLLITWVPWSVQTWLLYGLLSNQFLSYLLPVANPTSLVPKTSKLWLFLFYKLYLWVLLWDSVVLTTHPWTGSRIINVFFFFFVMCHSYQMGLGWV